MVKRRTKVELHPQRETIEKLLIGSSPGKTARFLKLAYPDNTICERALRNYTNRLEGYEDSQELRRSLRGSRGSMLSAMRGFSRRISGKKRRGRTVLRHPLQGEVRRMLIGGFSPMNISRWIAGKYIPEATLCDATIRGYRDNFMLDFLELRAEAEAKRGRKFQRGMVRLC